MIRPRASAATASLRSSGMFRSLAKWLCVPSGSTPNDLSLPATMSAMVLIVPSPPPAMITSALSWREASRAAAAISRPLTNRTKTDPPAAANPRSILSCASTARIAVSVPASALRRTIAFMLVGRPSFPCRSFCPRRFRGAARRAGRTPPHQQARPAGAIRSIRITRPRPAELFDLAPPGPYRLLPRETGGVATGHRVAERPADPRSEMSAAHRDGARAARKAYPAGRGTKNQPAHAWRLGSRSLAPLLPGRTRARDHMDPGQGRHLLQDVHR